MRNGENWGSQAGMFYVRQASCPPNSYPGGASGECECEHGFSEVGNTCEPLPPPPESCPASAYQGGETTPNPILLAAAQKYEKELDYVDHLPHPLTFSRNYLSKRASGTGNMGGGWTWSFSDALSLRTATNIDEPLAIVTTSDGGRTVFSQINGIWQPNDSVDSLVKNSQGWIYTSGTDNSTRQFDASGKLLTHAQRNGWSYKLTYDAQGKLTEVKNHFGRSLQLAYNGLGQISGFSVGGQTQATYEYDGAKRLTHVLYAGNTSKSYVYEKAAFPQALTGIIDENGIRLATYSYNDQGQPIQTVRAGGVGRYQVSYAPRYYGNTTVTDPLGTQRSYTYSVNLGKVAVASSSLPDGGGALDAASRTQSPLGLIESVTDFRNTSTTYQWDTSRRLRVATTEAVGTPESRTTQTTWHPQWRLPLSITEPGRTTTYAYDSLGNPLTQTITDTGGGSGSSGTTRTTSWTYHASGLVATETAPNGATTSYQYDTAGNLTRATNALGHVDTYTHDGAGRVLSHTAPTGLVSNYTYDARGRMLTANRGGQLTTLTYRPSGQVATASLPHGHVVTYTYDTAQRLTGWSDNRGNSGAYTLDAMGNRTREDLRNAQGQLVWRLARTINSINRVESVTLGNQTTTYGYDANGDWVAATNSLGQGTSLGLDALRRTKAITNAENATASLSYNALDGVTQASDFKGVATTYSRDALGNATTETSPDTGTEAAQYDALGLPSTITDALGQATTIERDLLGRPTLITHADGRTTTLRYDLTAASEGYLGEILDPSGTTTYERDTQGRVTKKTQRLINGDTRSVSYAYNAQGLLASTTYPGGQVLQHVYDTTGQLTGLTWAGQLLVSGITWNPLGQPTGWSWSLPGGAAPIPATRSYNTAGQVTATDFSSYQYDAAGRIQTLTQKLWRPASTNPQATTISQATSSWTVQYSPAGRIVGFTKTTAANAPVDTATFSYDANGNRTASTRDLAGTATSRTYGGDASHNRLLGFEQTTASTDGNTATTSVTYQYNPAGDLLGDGLTTYRYDSEGRMESASTGQGEDAPTTKYAHNGLGQRVFKTEPLYSSTPASGSSNKNLNNLLADDDEPQAEPPGLIQQILSFFSKLWSPSTSDAEKLGYSYVYAEDGSLLGEYGSGGSNSTGTAQYIYLPTANGPMPIAAVIKGQTYAVHSDHLNTPRKLTQPDGQVAWQWAYSAFGDEQPTIGAKRFTSESTTPTTGATSIPEVTFNLRYPGQYFDKETKLHYNYFRTYAPSTGRYTQGDPIGLDGGWNRFAYVGGDPINSTDRLGLAGDDHSTGQWKQCSKGCRIRIDFFLVDGVKVRHLHWECKKAEGVGGEFGGTSHGGTLEDAPKHIKGCAREHGFEPDPVCPPEPSLFERIRGAFSTPPIYDPRTDRWLPAPRRPPVIIPLPGRGPVPVL